MSLLEKTRIIKVYLKKLIKSIHFSEHIDLFLILALLILILSPFVVRFFLKLNAEIKKVNLLISPYCEELFGSETTEALFQDFMEGNPDLQLQVLNIPDEKDREPDIYIFDENEYRELISAGKLAQLNSYIELETNTMQYAVPLVSFMDLLFYNIELLASVGFDRPPKTREEFLSYAKAVSNTSNVRRAYVSGAAISLSPDDKNALSRDIFSWIWAAGGDFWQKENTPVLNVRMADAALSFFGSLYNEGVLAHDVFETTGDQRLEEFSRGRVSMIISSARAIPFLRERMSDDAFGITTIPLPGNALSGSTGKYKIGLSGIYAGISSKCEYPDEAWSFLVFLAGQHQLFVEVFKPVFCVASDIIPDEYITDDAFYSKARDIFESSEIIHSFSGNPKAQEYENAFLEELHTLLTGSRTVQETITSIQRQWDAISDK
jgi:multiple sugar transport system substrate-binding protein